MMRTSILMLTALLLGVGSLRAEHAGYAEAQHRLSMHMDDKNAFQRRQARNLQVALEHLKLGSPTDFRNRQGMTPLMLAAMSGEAETFEYLLMHGANPRLQAPGKVTMLMMAAAGGNMEVFNRVLQYMRADSRITDTVGTTLFQYACLGGNEELCSYILREGGDAFVVNKMGHSAILFAARGGNVELFHNLLGRGANPKLLTRDGFDLLMAAAQGGELQLVQTALNMGFSPKRADAAGNTALMAAASHAPVEVVAMLLRQGAEPDARNKKGVSAAMLAAAAGNAEACHLIGAKADTAPDAAGRSLLVYAASGGSHTLVRHLLQQGADPAAKDRLALRTAVAAGHTYAALEIAAHLPNISRHDLHSIPLRTIDDAIAFSSFMAERCKDPADKAVATALMQQMLRASADPAALSHPAEDDAQGATPLQNAIAGRFYSFFVFLLEEGADVNACNAQGKTALMTAVELGDYTAVKRLLQAGANPNAMDRSGYTAIIIAAEYADYATFNLLAEHGAKTDLYRRGGPTALQSAMSAGPDGQELVNRLMGRPTRPTTRAEAFAQLCKALEEDNRTAFERLLRDWPEPDAANAEGTTLLMLAASGDCPAFYVQHLVNKGANVNATDSHGFTPLMYAKTQEKRDILRKAGAVN